MAFLSEMFSLGLLESKQEAEKQGNEKYFNEQLATEQFPIDKIDREVKQNIGETLNDINESVNYAEIQDQKRKIVMGAAGIMALYLLFGRKKR